MISGPALRSYKLTLLVAHVDYIGKQLWQMPRLTLDATPSSLILNCDSLHTAAQSLGDISASSITFR